VRERERKANRGVQKEAKKRGTQGGPEVEAWTKEGRAGQKKM
jgi:hypothetical protein